MQFIEGNVAGNRMALLARLPRRRFPVTDLANAPRTAPLKGTSERWRREFNDTLGRQSGRGVGIGLQHRAEQHLGVGVGGKAIDVLAGPISQSRPW